MVTIAATSRSMRLAPVSHHVGVKVASRDNIDSGSDSPDGVAGGSKISYRLRQLIKMMDRNRGYLHLTSRSCYSSEREITI